VPGEVRARFGGRELVWNRLLLDFGHGVKFARKVWLWHYPVST